MSAHPAIPSGPGGAAVGHMEGLPPLAGLSVRSLRRWCDEGEGALALDLAASLGTARGDAAAASFGALCRLCLAAARRPLLRHGPLCPCVGADEAAFAELVTQAAQGEREDALMLACCLVRIDLAPTLVGHAQAAGLHLVRALVPRGLATLH